MSLLVNGEDIVPAVRAWLLEQAEHWPPWPVVPPWPTPFGELVTSYGQRAILPRLPSDPGESAAVMRQTVTPLPVEWYATLIDGTEVTVAVPQRAHNCRFEYCTHPAGQCPHPE